MKNYLVVYERDDKGWGAYLPDLPGCVAVGKDQQECEELIRETVRIHLAAMRRDNDSIPEPASFAGTLTVDDREEGENPVRELVRMRIAAGLTQEQVAKRMGIPRERVAELEKSPDKVRFERVRAYARAIDADLEPRLLA